MTSNTIYTYPLIYDRVRIVNSLTIQPPWQNPRYMILYFIFYNNHNVVKVVDERDFFFFKMLQPCCHFARHSCMKGDECPFDHQLSKYPCNNYLSKGFCPRGSDCMFSHEVLFYFFIIIFFHFLFHHIK